MNKRKYEELNYALAQTVEDMQVLECLIAVTLCSYDLCPLDNAFGGVAYIMLPSIIILCLIMR